MFRIEQYKVCPHTGVTDISILFNIGTGIREDKRSYYEKQDADKCLYKMKRDYILIMFQNFIYHSQVLMEVGNRAYYCTEAKGQSMDKLKRANKWFNEDLPLNTICEWVLKLEEDLIRILPAPNNNSRQSSENKLRDMIVFARQNCELKKIDKKEPVEI
jgi:hypothetical protein